MKSTFDLSLVCVSCLGLLAMHCGVVDNSGAADSAGTREPVGAEPAPVLEACPHPRINSEGEWVLFETHDATFSETLVSSAGEDSFRTLSCGAENSARQPSFEWIAPSSGSFSFSFVLPDFTVPAPVISLAVLSGDCHGEELFCKSSPTTRVGFDLELTEGERVTVLIELDDRVGADDMELAFAISPSQ